MFAKIFIALSFVLIITDSDVRAQTTKSSATKLETIQWLLQKLNTYQQGWELKKNNGYKWEIYDQKFFFDDSGSGIEVEVDYFTKITSPNGSIDIAQHKCKIPVYDIEWVKDFEGTIFFKSYSNSIQKHNLTTDKLEIAQSAFFGIKFESEANLADRIGKAFMHLKELIQEQRSKEPF